MIIIQKKKSFVLYQDYYEHLKMLSVEERGYLITAIFDYLEGGAEPVGVSIAVRMAFSFIKGQLDRDLAKYEERCEKNRKNILKRYEKAENQTENLRSYTNVYLNDTDTDTENDTDTDTVTDTATDTDTDTVNEGRRGRRPLQDDTVNEGRRGRRPLQGDTVNEGRRGRRPLQDDAVNEGRRGRRPLQGDAVNEGRRGRRPLQDDIVNEGRQGCRPLQDDAVNEGGGASEGDEAAAGDREFDEFWREYPKHYKRAEAKQAFADTVKSREDYARLMELLGKWKRSDEWKRDGGRWIKRADRFILDIFTAEESPPEHGGSFDTDEFFEAALRRSYEEDSA